MSPTRIAVLACAALVLSLASSSTAAPGDLDPTFNGGHLVLIDLAKAGSTGTGLYSAQVDGAGRIVVAGFTLDENLLLAAALARLLPDGTLDPTFGEGGKRVIQAGAGGGNVFSMLKSLVPRSGGGWAATGGASASDGRQAALVLAVDDAGNPDLNFGTGGSTRAQVGGAAPAYTLAFGGGGGGAADATGSLFLAHGILLDPMNSSDSRLAAAKFTPGGTLAGGFGTGGIYTNTFSQASSKTTYGWGALPTSDGILVAGSTLDAVGNSAFLLARLTAFGTLDTTFAGGAGYRVVQASDPLAPTVTSQATSIALGPGGLIHLAGTASDADGHSALTVARFTAGGALDSSFHGGGIVHVQTASADAGSPPGSIAYGIAVQADGSILVIGSSGSGGYTEMVVVRLTPAGDVDPSFGTGGVVRLQPGTGSEATTFGFGGTIAPDGETLLATGQMRQVGGRGVVARIMLTSPTTTTTLPDSCAPAASLAAALCQLQDLATLIASTVPGPGRLHDRLAGSIAKCTSDATASGQQSGRAHRKSLKRALNALKRFQHQLKAKAAQRTIPTETRADFANRAAEVATTLAALRDAA